MSYAVEHEKWLKDHLKRRKTSRLDALKRGHGYGNQLFLEKIWWKLLGHFDNLHPEYEILDWRGFPFYADFMWILGSTRIVFEIQDFGSHVQNMDRIGYRRELSRGMFMQSLQYVVVYVSLDELKENPVHVLNMISIILSPYIGATNANLTAFSRLEKELMRLGARHNRVLRPVVAAKELEVSGKTIIKHMQILMQKGRYRAIKSGVSERITRYELIGPLSDHHMF